MRLLYLLTLLFLPFVPETFAVNASPHRFKGKQPDGSVTELRVVGDAENHNIIDEEGYTVIEDDEDWFVYAEEDVTTGEIKPTHFKVGKEDPKKHGLKKGLKGKEKRGKGKKRYLRPQKSSRKLITTGKLRNLVIMVKFSDHANRILPTSNDINILFNKLGGHQYLAPTGSVRDVYQENSYGTLDLVSTIYPWITLPKTEAYYSDSNYGDNPDILLESLKYALNEIDKDPNFSFTDFDMDKDGLIDAITFLHSGYGAEWGATDYYGQPSYNRIWSHMSSLSWTSSKSEVRVEYYHISPAVWDIRGSNIGRIGVIAHELGHFLGLPDLYDTVGGNGIGSYDLMSNCWGFDGSQLYPPLMSAWSKIQLGWIIPQIITENGVYEIPAAKKAPFVYKIENEFPSGEYLLIENRQPLGFDAMITQGGLAIWHIDENAALTMEGFPGQSGWPENGNHYRVSLLQADGLYDLEQGLYYGDSKDLWHAGGKNSLGPSKSIEGPHPNTDAYQNGDIRKTGIEISGISSAANNMLFQVSLDGKPVNVASDSLELVTTFQGGDREYGCMFDILPRQNLIIKNFSLNLKSTTELVTVEIWTKRFSYRGYEQDASAWKKIGEVSIRGNGAREPTLLPLKSFNPLPVQKHRKQAFYLTVKDRKIMLATENSGNPTRIYKQNDDLRIFAGVANKYLFGSTFSPRVWNGGIRYSLSNEIETTFSGGSGQAGTMFDVIAAKKIAVMSMELNLETTEVVIVEVWTRHGSHVGAENIKTAWKRIGRKHVKGRGKGNRTPLHSTHFPPVKISNGNTQAFYVTLTDSITMRYTDGDTTGTVYFENEDLKVLVGTGKKYPFGQSYNARVWNGILNYVVA